jgi:hypothetical protein
VHPYKAGLTGTGYHLTIDMIGDPVRSPYGFAFDNAAWRTFVTAYRRQYESRQAVPEFGRGKMWGMICHNGGARKCEGRCACSEDDASRWTGPVDSAVLAAGRAQWGPGAVVA